MLNRITIICLCLFSLSSANAVDIFVNAGESIQDAINVASPGDTIVVSEGIFVENITIPGTKTGLSIVGQGAGDTTIVSDGGDLNPKNAPPTVPADIIIDIFAANVTVSNLGVLHPTGETSKRDIGIFFRPPAVNGTVSHCEIERERTGLLEPTKPGSRGLLIFRARGITISNNEFEGNYEDHIHLPTSATTVVDNEVEDATRIGIVVIQESATSLSENNMIAGNEVSGSGTDGIQIQGDKNTVSDNEAENNAGAGIRICGPSSVPSCVAPGGSVSADNNLVTENETKNNAGGGILDFGVSNTVTGNEVK